MSRFRSLLYSFLILFVAAAVLSSCGIGGMTRAMQPVVDRLEEGERVSCEIRGGGESERE